MHRFPLALLVTVSLGAPSCALSSNASGADAGAELGTPTPVPSDADTETVLPSPDAVRLACTASATNGSARVPSALDEISGIVADPRDPNVIWAIEDSGNPAAVSALGSDGTLRATTTIVNATNVDWEDLAIGPCGAAQCLYIADIGDNRARRDAIDLLRTPLPPFDADTTAEVERMRVQWPAGPRDAEALVVFPDETVVLLSKEVGVAQLAGAPFQASETPTTLRDMGALSLEPWRPGGLLTAADLVDGRLLIRLYSDVIALVGVDAPEDIPTAEAIVLPDERETQGESLAWTSNGYATVSEGNRPPIHFFDCDDAPP